MTAVVTFVGIDPPTNSKSYFVVGDTVCVQVLVDKRDRFSGGDFIITAPWMSQVLTPVHFKGKDGTARKKEYVFKTGPGECVDVDYRHKNVFAYSWVLDAPSGGPTELSLGPLKASKVGDAGTIAIEVRHPEVYAIGDFLQNDIALLVGTTVDATVNLERNAYGGPSIVCFEGSALSVGAVDTEVAEGESTGEAQLVLDCPHVELQDLALGVKNRCVEAEGKTHIWRMRVVDQTATISNASDRTSFVVGETISIKAELPYRAPLQLFEPTLECAAFEQAEALSFATTGDGTATADVVLATPCSGEAVTLGTLGDFKDVTTTPISIDVRYPEVHAEGAQLKDDETVLVGSTIAATVTLEREAYGEASKVTLESSAMSAAVTGEVAAGETSVDVELVLDQAGLEPQKVTFSADDRCTAAANKIHEWSIRVVEQTARISNASNKTSFLVGEEITIDVELPYGAPLTLFQPTLTCPAFDQDEPLSFATSATGQLSVTVELTKPGNSLAVALAALGDFSDVTAAPITIDVVAIKAEFSSTPPVPDGPYVSGEKVSFTVELDHEPLKSTTVRIECGCFPMASSARAVDVLFAVGETSKEVDILLEDGDTPLTESTTFTATLVAGDFYEPGTRQELKFDVLPKPKLDFASAWIEPVKDEYLAGDEVNLTVELDADAPREDGAEIRIKCDAFAADLVKTIAKGDKRGQYKVTFDKGRDDPKYELNLTPGSFGCQEGTEIKKELLVRASPKLNFTQPTSVTPSEALYALDATVEFHVELDAPAPRDCKFRLDSNLFSGTTSQTRVFEIKKGQTAPDDSIQLKLTRGYSDDSGPIEVPVNLAVVESCVLGPHNELQLKVSDDREVIVQFRAKTAAIHLDPLSVLDPVRIGVVLNAAAGPAGATVKLSCPQMTKISGQRECSIRFNYGELRNDKTIITFDPAEVSAPADVTLTLSDPSGSVVGDRKTLKLKVHPLPEASFDDKLWVSPVGETAEGPYDDGESVVLMVVLGHAAPVTPQANLQLRSTAIMNSPVPVAFAGGEVKAQVAVQLTNPGTTAQDVFLEVKGGKSAGTDAFSVASSPAKHQRTLLVREVPEVRFVSTHVAPSKGPHDENDDVSFHVKLSASSPAGSTFRLRSSAFPGKARIIEIAKGSDAPAQEIKVTLTKGFMIGSTPLPQKVRVLPLSGCKTGSPDLTEVIVRGATVPDPSDPAHPCPSTGLPPKELLDPCNTHGMRLLEMHGADDSSGANSKAAKRGPEPDGSFVVATSKAWDWSTTGKAEIGTMSLQVIAGKAETEDDQPFHLTFARLHLSAKDYFCNETYGEDADGDGYEHPRIQLWRQDGEGWLPQFDEAADDDLLNHTKAPERAKKHEHLVLSIPIEPYEPPKSKLRAAIEDKLFKTPAALFRALQIARGVLPPQHFKITVDTCGLPNDGSLPARSVAAALEVFPSDEYALLLEVKAIPTYTAGSDGSLIDKTGEEQSQESTVDESWKEIPDEDDITATTSSEASDVSTPATIDTDGLSFLGTPTKASDKVTHILDSAAPLVSEGPATLENDYLFYPSKAEDEEEESEEEESFGWSGKFFPEISVVLMRNGQSLLSKSNSSEDEEEPSGDDDPSGDDSSSTTPAEDPGWGGIQKKVDEGLSGFGKALNTVLTTIQAITVLIDTVQDLVPSYGLSFKFELGLLEGKLAFRWGYKEHVESALVFPWKQLDLDMTLIRLGFVLKFGIGASLLFIKFEAALSLTISGSVGMQAKRQIIDPSGKWGRTENWATLRTKATIKLHVTLVSDRFFTAGAAITGGYEWKFCIANTENFALQYESRSLGIQFVLTATLVGFDVGKTFDLVKADSTPARQGILFPKGVNKSYYMARVRLRTLWDKMIEAYAPLQDALEAWYKLQLRLCVELFDPADAEIVREYQRDNTPSGRPPRGWPFTEHPGVSLGPTTRQPSITESRDWTDQWAVCLEGLCAIDATVTKKRNWLSKARLKTRFQKHLLGEAGTRSATAQMGLVEFVERVAKKGMNDLLRGPFAELRALDKLVHDTERLDDGSGTSQQESSLPTILRKIELAEKTWPKQVAETANDVLKGTNGAFVDTFKRKLPLNDQRFLLRLDTVRFYLLKALDRVAEKDARRAKNERIANAARWNWPRDSSDPAQLDWSKLTATTTLPTNVTATPTSSSSTPPSSGTTP